MKTIVAGYDGTRSAEHALTRVAELAQAFHARVIVVSVSNPQPNAAPGAFGLTPYYYETGEAERRLDEALLEQHRDHVKAFFAGSQLPVEFTGAVGEPAGEIVEAAHEHGADLIVVGTREPGLLERLLGGSVSQGVARRARCDVLIVHPPEGEEA
jgi:nucleotide-binding universal stress UspA family protein